MLTFSDLTIENACSLRPYFEAGQYRLCDYTPGTAGMWATHYATRFCIHEGMLILKMHLEDGSTCFSIPMGNGDFDAALDAIDEFCRESGIPTTFDPVPDEVLPIIADHFDCALTVHHSPGWDDYLYDKEDIITLKGRRYNTQRNHINKFKSAYPNYEYQPITCANVDEVRAFFHMFMDISGKTNAEAVEEREMTMAVLDRFDPLCQVGGVIKVDGKIVSMAIGETLGDTLYIHIEKGLRDYPGSYPMINMEFAAHNDSEQVRYVNREEDMGEPGLRQAKRQYHPVKMVRKYGVMLPGFGDR